MKKNLLFKVLLIVVFMLAMGVFGAGCGDDGSGDDEGDEDGDITAPEDNYAANYGLDEPFELNFATGEEIYYVFLYNQSTDGEDITVTLTSEEGEATVADSEEEGTEEEGDTDTEEEGEEEEGGETARKMATITLNNSYTPVERASHIWDNPVLAKRWAGKLAVSDRQERTERMLRETGAQFLVNQPNRKEGECLSTACEAGQVCQNGECTAEPAIKLVDMSGNLHEFTCVVQARGEHSAVLVDGESEVSDADAQAIADTFDSTLYARDMFFYGAEGVEASDVNGDGLVWFVLSSKINDEGQAVGWFDANDLTTGENSNQADLLFMVTPDDDNPLSSVYGTAAHEYVHLMHYSIRVLNGMGDEERWLKEGIAHLGEDLSGFGGDNVDAVKALFDGNFSEVSQISTDEDTVPMRALNYMMVRYMFEKKGGAEFADDGTVTDKGGADFLKSLVSSSDVSLANVAATYGTDYLDWQFDYYTALIADTTGSEGVLADKKYNFDDPTTDGLTGGEIGLCTHCTRKNSAGEDIEFTGPDAAEDFSADELEADTVPIGGYLYKAEATVEAGKKLTVTATSDGSAVRVGVVRVK